MPGVRSPVGGRGLGAQHHGRVDEPVVAGHRLERQVEGHGLAIDDGLDLGHDLVGREVDQVHGGLRIAQPEQVDDVFHADVLGRQAAPPLGGLAGGRILVGVEEDIAGQVAHRRAGAVLELHRDDGGAVGSSGHRDDVHGPIGIAHGIVDDRDDRNPAGRLDARQARRHRLAEPAGLAVDRRSLPAAGRASWPRGRAPSPPTRWGRSRRWPGRGRRWPSRRSPRWR